MSQRNTRYISILTLLVLSCASVEGGFFSRLAHVRLDDELAISEGMSSDGQIESITLENGIALAVLRNNSKIPLVGFGVGNLHDGAISTMVAEAIQDDKKTRLIDTSQVSGNEALVAEGILKGVERMHLTEKLQVHVVTKVWYTHLGYERTKLSVEESLRAFDPVLKSDKVDLHLHFLLHWPRCFDNVHFMDCEKDEANLPQYIKDAGPDPAKNPEGAWKESWKMLEDLYLSKQHPVESIGVANFHLTQLEKFDTFARFRPRFIQVNLWSLIYDHKLIQYCLEHRIHVQVYHIMQQTLMKPEVAPNAFHHIQKIAYDLSGKTATNVTPAQVLLAWLIQHGVSVAPRTSKMDRLVENSAAAVSSMPVLTDKQVETLAHAVEAYLSGKDLEGEIPVSISFHAATKDMMVYWVNNVDEVRLALVQKGQKFNETTYEGHTYRLYDASNKDIYIDHVVEAHLGYHETVNVDLESLGLSSETEAVLASPRAEDVEKAGVFNWLGGMLHLKK